MSEQYPPCTLHAITDHVWWFTPEDHTDRPSLCAVVGDERVLLLDVGASVAHTNAFLDALQAVGVAAPDYAVLTHWHWDHIFGMAALTCPLIAHRDTAENIERMMSLDYSDDNLPQLVAEQHEVDFTREHLMREMTDGERRALRLRPPEMTFEKRLQVSLGGITCEIVHVGGDHAADAVVIHVVEDSLLFLGDCLYYTVYQLPQHYTEAKILPLIDRLTAFDADMFIMGHANEIYTKQAMADEFSLIRTCCRALSTFGVERVDEAKDRLYETHDSEDIDYYLTSLLAGLDLPS